MDGPKIGQQSGKQEFSEIGPSAGDLIESTVIIFEQSECRGPWRCPRRDIKLTAEYMKLDLVSQEGSELKRKVCKFSTYGWWLEPLEWIRSSMYSTRKEEEKMLRQSPSKSTTLRAYESGFS